MYLPAEYHASRSGGGEQAGQRAQPLLLDDAARRGGGAEEREEQHHADEHLAGRVRVAAAAEPPGVTGAREATVMVFAVWACELYAWAAFAASADSVAGSVTPCAAASCAVAEAAARAPLSDWTTSCTTEATIAGPTVTVGSL